MVRAWFFHEDGSDQRKPHRGADVSLGTLANLGVLYWTIPVSTMDMDKFSSPGLDAIRRDRNYKNFDTVNIKKPTFPNFEEKVKMFFEEHLHTDEEVRYVMDGSGYFDIRDGEDRWIRIEVVKNDLIVLPAGMYHRFSLDDSEFAYVMRLFQEAPQWKAYNRSTDVDKMAARDAYLRLMKQTAGAEQKDTSGTNGTAFILTEHAQGLANYPHMRRVGNMLYVSGLSSRRADNTHQGAVKNEDGTWTLSIEDQTRGVLENMRKVLATAGASLSDVVDLTCFLVDMKDYKGFNSVYDQYFTAATGPTRTTIAVKQLPHPNLVIEIKAVAVVPSH